MRNVLRNGLVLLVAALPVFYFACSAESRFKTLSFFFDGVPQPDTSSVAAADSALGGSGNRGVASTSSFPVQPTLFLHEPYREKACDSCHNNIGSNALVEKPPELCYGCHDDKEPTQAVIHGPVSAGLCTTCHNPHVSKFEKMLFASGRAVCFKCHEQRDVLASETHGDIEDMNCTECHDPHESDEEYLLR